MHPSDLLAKQRDPKISKNEDHCRKAAYSQQSLLAQIPKVGHCKLPSAKLQPKAKLHGTNTPVNSLEGVLRCAGLMGLMGFIYFFFFFPIFTVLSAKLLKVNPVSRTTTLNQHRMATGKAKYANYQVPHPQKHLRGSVNKIQSYYATIGEWTVEQHVYAGAVQD